MDFLIDNLIVYFILIGNPSQLKKAYEPKGIVNLMSNLMLLS